MTVVSLLRRPLAEWPNDDGFRVACWGHLIWRKEAYGLN